MCLSLVHAWHPPDEERPAMYCQSGIVPRSSLVTIRALVLRLWCVQVTDEYASRIAGARNVVYGDVKVMLCSNSHLGGLITLFLVSRSHLTFKLFLVVGTGCAIALQSSAGAAAIHT